MAAEIRNFYVQHAREQWYSQIAQDNQLPSNQRNGLPIVRAALQRELATRIANAQNDPLKGEVTPNFLISKKWSKEDSIATFLFAVAAIILIGAVLVTLSYAKSDVADALRFGALNKSGLGIGLIVGTFVLLLGPIGFAGYQLRKKSHLEEDIKEFDKFLKGEPIKATTFFKLRDGETTTVNWPSNVKIDLNGAANIDRSEFAAIPMHEIVPGLFLGNQWIAGEKDIDTSDAAVGYRKQEIRDKNIGHIIRCIVPSKKVENYSDGEYRVDYTNYNISDNSTRADPNGNGLANNPDQSTADIKQVFDETFEIIERTIKSGRSVLIHCNAGISRSPTIVIAYLMRKNNWTFAKALKAVQDIRPCVQPRPEFVDQLREYEDHLRAAGTGLN